MNSLPKCSPSLAQVGKKYATVSMASTFPASFLQPLLNMSVVPNPGELD